MTYSIPAAANSTYVARTTGRSDAIHNEISSRIEEPKFVDNAIHHAIYENAATGDTKLIKLKIKPPTQTDFIPTHQRKYILSEQESAVRVAHTDRKSTPFFNGELLSPTSTLPPLLIDAEQEDLRLKTNEIISTTYGAGIILTNMRGKQLKSYGMGDTTHVRLGQVFSVGLRTTDLVQRLFKDALHGLNSIGVGMPITNSNSISGDNMRNRHSNTFVAKDFYSTAIPTAVRAIARYDHYSIFHDRFGNFIYSPKLFKVTDREIGQRRGSGSATTDPIVAAANRIVVEGEPFALNDSIRSMVDDVEAQKKEGSIRQMRITVPTATNELQARRSANQLLRLNRKAQGAMKSKEHAQSWDLQPGEVATYSQSGIGEVNSKKAIIEVKHTQSGLSEFQFTSYESGLEGVLNAFAADKEMSNEATEPDRASQITTVNKTGIGRMQLKVKMYMELRRVSPSRSRRYTDSTITPVNTGGDIHSGFIIGHRNTDANNGTRSAIGSGYAMRISTTSTLSGTTITLAGGTTTTGFPSTGVLVINESVTATYTGITSGTFTGVIILAPNGGTIPSSIPELKLLRARGHDTGANKMLRRRRRL
tara:strand:- start:1725 stop:3497 length:1773 start_codon:yes stop_codon:yes gene_type:complete